MSCNTLVFLENLKNFIERDFISTIRNEYTMRKKKSMYIEKYRFKRISLYIYANVRPCQKRSAAGHMLSHMTLAGFHAIYIFASN